jgi:uncharacterized protein
MHCPACGRVLQKMAVGDLAVDVCQDGCGGIWFDNFELGKVDESHEAAGEPLLDVACDEASAVDMTQRRHCPKCESITMLRRYFGVAQDVEIDECGGCGGIWLDHGELARIRGQYASPGGTRAGGTRLHRQLPEAARRNARRERTEDAKRQAIRAHVPVHMSEPLSSGQAGLGRVLSEDEMPEKGHEERDA